MFAGRHQHTSQIDQRLAVQLQRLNGRSSGWGKAKNMRSVHIPCKVFRPAISAWMEQGNHFAGNRVARLGAIVFVIVAEVAIALPLIVTGLDRAWHIR